MGNSLLKVVDLNRLNSDVKAKYPTVNIIYEKLCTYDDNFGKALNPWKTLARCGMPAIIKHKAPVVFLLGITNEIRNMHLPDNVKLEDKHYREARYFAHQLKEFATRITTQTNCKVKMFEVPSMVSDNKRQKLIEYTNSLFMENDNKSYDMAKILFLPLTELTKNDIYGTNGDGIHFRGNKATLIVTYNITQEVLRCAEEYFATYSKSLCVSYYKSGKCDHQALCKFTYHDREINCRCSEASCKKMHSEERILVTPPPPS